MEIRLTMSVCKWLLAVTCCLGMFSAEAAGLNNDQEMYERERSISKAFAAHATTTVEIVNKYGTVHVNTWDKDSVRFEIQIKVKAKRYEDAEAMSESTTFNLGGSSSFITAQTIFGENSNMFKQSWMDLKSELGFTKVTVDYVVYLPATNKVSISNKFGDIYLPMMEGDLRIDLSHGDLRAKSIKEAKKLKARYGSVNIDVLEEGKLDLGSVDLIMEEAGEISIKSTSSEVHLEEVKELFIESTYDKFFIEEVERLSGESKFSHIKVKRMSAKLDLTTKYGSITVNKVQNGFQRVNLTGEYTDYTVSFDAASSCNFDVQLDDGRDFTYPSNGIEVTTDSLYTETIHGYQGYIGKNSDAAQVRIHTKRSYVKFDYY